MQPLFHKPQIRCLTQKDRLIPQSRKPRQLEAPEITPNGLITLLVASSYSSTTYNDSYVDSQLNRKVAHRVPVVFAD